MFEDLIVETILAETFIECVDCEGGFTPSPDGQECIRKVSFVYFILIPSFT